MAGIDHDATMALHQRMMADPEVHAAMQADPETKAPGRLKGPAAEALTARVGSAGMAVAKTAAKAASKSVGRGE